MKYENPVIRGFYPDPSICKAGDIYYLVCSSMQYSPGVPIFESTDLIHWKQIGHCLTRKSQLHLDQVNSSGGVFAPTIRYHEGRFYMTTTNDTTHQNFYIWTDDIYGEWSEPIFVQQGGIDPSLFFEKDKAYFMSNGSDEEGLSGIVQCEIDIKTGKKLCPSRTIWRGTGGRYLEAPHLYHIEDSYYLVAAEGGTEYGHMVTYARGNTPFGPFEAYAKNPVLTNRNLGGYEIQGVGHGDLIQDADGNWWMFHLGFRQTGQWSTFHHLGREVFLTPITFHEDGWFTAGENGVARKHVETDRLSDLIEQKLTREETFESTDWNIDWCYLRWPNRSNYLLEDQKVTLRGSNISLDEADSPTFIGIRQKEFKAIISCTVNLTAGEAGITLYMDEHHHYDFAIQKEEEHCKVIERLNIGDIKSIQNQIDVKEEEAIHLKIYSDNYQYRFCAELDQQEICLGNAQTRYLSSEVAGGFTGVIIGLYAYSETNDSKAVFTKFECKYTE